MLRNERIELGARGRDTDLGLDVCVPSAFLQPRLVRVLALDETFQVGRETGVVAVCQRLALRFPLNVRSCSQKTQEVIHVNDTVDERHAAPAPRVQRPVRVAHDPVL